MNYNNFTSNTFDANITQKKLVNKPYLNEKLKTLATKKTIATKVKLYKIANLQTYDLNGFIRQSYFNNDRAQLYLIFNQVTKLLHIF